MSDETVRDLERNNFAVFMERGPGLSRRYAHWVIKKCSVHRCVMLGGLGGMGVGQMWFGPPFWDEDEPNFADAQEVCEEPDKVRLGDEPCGFR